MKKRITLFTLFLLMGAGFVFYLVRNQEPTREVGIRVSGTIELTEVDCAFKISGMIEELKFDEGDAVKEGELIARLDDRELLDRGTVQAVLKINRDFAKKVKREEDTAVQLILDGTDSNTANLIVQYVTSIVGQYSREIMRERIDRQLSRQLVAGKVDELRRVGEVTLQQRAWSNPDLASRLFFVPGVIAMILMLVITLLTAMAIVREKEIGTLEQLMVSPIRPPELILGKSIPFILVGYADMILITIVAVYWFEIPIRGSSPLLFVSASLYLLSALGFGLFISTISETQQQAMMTNFFFFLPMTLLSGFAFPIANMPRAVKIITYANPIRYFLVIIWGIFLKGIGLEVLWHQLADLALIGTMLLTISSLRFRKRIE